MPFRAIILILDLFGKALVTVVNNDSAFVISIKTFRPVLFYCLLNCEMFAWQTNLLHCKQSLRTRMVKRDKNKVQKKENIFVKFGIAVI